MNSGKLRKFNHPHLLIFLVISLLLISPAFMGKTYYLLDYSFYAYPVKHFLVDCWMRKETPLWNPFVLLGVPYLFDMSTGGFLNPFNLLLILPFSLPLKLALFVAFHLLLAGAGMYFSLLLLLKDKNINLSP